jgi:flagellar protein FlbT
VKRNVHLSLRAGERIFVNGAVLKVDRKVSVELMNEATYLLEHQILQPQETTTPLKQTYFVLQSMLMDPAGTPLARQLFDESLPWLTKAFANKEVLAGIEEATGLVAEGNIFAALKVIRTLFPLEDAILGRERGETIKVMEVAACS